MPQIMAKRIFQFIGLALLIGIGIYIYVNYHTWDEIGKLSAQIGIFIGGGILLAYYVATSLLPRLGDAAAGSLLGSNEKVKEEEINAAASKLAQGDYAGAVDEYQKLREKNPDDTLPVWEIAKLYAERLNAAPQAAEYLLLSIESQDWSENDLCFLKFRLADIRSQHLEDYEGARLLMNEIVADFPETRHSANASHQIRKLEEAEFAARQKQ
jgi:outer membrane protein assembly factor BamD (BamD/ComL family)